MGIGCSVAYIYGNSSQISPLTQNLMTALLVVIAFLDNVGSYICVTINMDKLNTLAEEIQEIVDKGEKTKNTQTPNIVYLIFF